MARKAAAGSGSIRKREKINADGKKTILWEGRYSVGFDPGTGKQVQRSIYGKTQKEVASKLRDIEKNLEEGTYTAPTRMTVAQWLDTWASTYLVTQKPLTIEKYKVDINNHIKPHIGAVRLQELRAEQIQAFYNGLPLSPKSVRNIHGVLHKALGKAVVLGYIPQNPAGYCELKKAPKPEIVPLDPQQLVPYVRAAQDDSLGNMLTVVVFTGMRRGELMGLCWEQANFAAGSILIDRQMAKGEDSLFHLATTKSSKSRLIYPARIAMDALRNEKQQQLQNMQAYTEYFDNPHNLVFTTADGTPINKDTLRRHHKQVLSSAGLPDIRLHDLRHSYAVTALQAGDDIKTVQESLGHATASFTLDVYTHALDGMKKKSASNIQRFFDKKSGKGTNKGTKKKA